MKLMRIFWAAMLVGGGALGTGRAAEARAKVTDLAWLAGDWEGAGPGGAVVHAHYSEAAGGVIVSATKEIRTGRATSYDFEHLGEKDGTIIYTPHPGGRKSVSFPLVTFEAGAKRAVFENRQHDFPQRFTFALVETDRLVITLSGPGKNGEERALVYDFRRKRG